MKNDHLKYYLVFFINETLFAYGNAHEFFEMYDRKNKKWIISKISYSQMLHDLKQNIFPLSNKVHTLQTIVNWHQNMR